MKSPGKQLCNIRRRPRLTAIICGCILLVSENINPAIPAQENPVFPVNFMDLTVPTIMLSKEQWCCMHTVAYLIQKWWMIFARAMAAPPCPLIFYSS